MTPKQEAALRLAREALVVLNKVVLGTRRAEEAITAKDEALAEPKEKYQYGTPLLDAMTGNAEQPAHVAAVNTSSERVDKTAENVHEQPAQQEPVANYCKECLTYNGHHEGCSHYASPPASKPWVGLGEDEIDECFRITPDQHLPWHIYQRIEAKLKERNT